METVQPSQPLPPIAQSAGSVKELAFLAALTQKPLAEMEMYQQLFGLQTISRQEKVEPQQYRSLPADVAFLILALYDEHDAIFYVRDYSSNRGWELPGGRCQPHESLVESVTRIAKRDAGCELAEVRAVCLCENVFTCEGNQKVHSGIVFAARCFSAPAERPERSGKFMSAIPEALPFANRDIVTFVQRSLAHRQYDTPLEEVKANQTHRLAHAFHTHFVSPIVASLSSHRLRRAVQKHVPTNAMWVLDAACGYDDLLFDLTSEKRICVGNDISWSMVQLLAQHSAENVIFTNYNFVDARFAKRFDVALVKNTLHHMRSMAELTDALRNLANQTKRLIIMDIDDPTRSTWWSRAWHAYYVHFLGDRGGLFLQANQFEIIAKTLFPTAEVTMEKVATVKGIYYLATIDFDAHEGN